MAAGALWILDSSINASALPWLLTNALHVGQGNAGPHSIAYPVRLSFHFGGAAFLIVVLWTVITTKEYPPENMEEFRASQRKHTGIAATFRDIARAWSEMPTNMARLGIVQLRNFMGLFCMWLYFGVAVAHNIFGAQSADSPAFREGIEWAGV